MKRILIIEDDKIYRETLIDILENEEWEILAAENGTDGLKLQFNTPFDLVITDILMPDKDGIEVILEIRNFFPDTKILAMTGGGYMEADSILEMAEILGVNKVLKKPAAISQIIDAVYELINNHEISK